MITWQFRTRGGCSGEWRKHDTILVEHRSGKLYPIVDVITKNSGIMWIIMVNRNSNRCQHPSWEGRTHYQVSDNQPLAQWKHRWVIWIESSYSRRHNWATYWLGSALKLCVGTSALSIGRSWTRNPPLSLIPFGGHCSSTTERCYQPCHSVPSTDAAAAWSLWNSLWAPPLLAPNVSLSIIWCPWTWERTQVLERRWRTLLHDTADRERHRRRCKNRKSHYKNGKLSMFWPIIYVKPLSAIYFNWGWNIDVLKSDQIRCTQKETTLDFD